jgi:hypothetical protein
MKDEGIKKEVGEKDEDSKQEVGEEFQTTNTCEGSKQEVQEEKEEPLELLSDLDLLYSHYLDSSLPIVLERLLTSPYMSQALWGW